MTIKSTFSALLFLATTVVSSQDLLKILEKERSNNPTYAEATFSHSRITFGQSTQTRKKGVLDVFVSNRFWDTPADRSQSFIADRMSARIAVEYGITDYLLFGIGGTTFDGRFDGFLKYNVIKQRSDDQGFPFNDITLTLRICRRDIPVTDHLASLCRSGRRPVESIANIEITLTKHIVHMYTTTPFTSSVANNINTHHLLSKNRNTFYEAQFRTITC